MNRINSQFLYTTSAKASLFDIVAEESLRSSLKPAWEYICKVLKSKYPRHVSTLLNYSDELFYSALFILEEYSLRMKSASITESFYELTRESSSSISSFMLQKARWISIISIVIIPYILTKLEKHYERVKEQILSNDITVTPRNKKFYELYPIILTITKWIRILNYILYLFNYTNYAFPILNLTRIQLKYASTNSTDATDKKINEPTNIVIRVLRRLTDALLSMISRLTPIMFYSLQFMDTYFQEDGGGMMQKSMSKFAVPEPPSMPKVVSSEIKLPSSKKQCPLCRQSHVNPSTTAISGFVFCYSCLYKYIDKFACCPITYRPCNVGEIIRLHS